MEIPMMVVEEANMASMHPRISILWLMPRCAGGSIPIGTITRHRTRNGTMDQKTKFQFKASVMNPPRTLPSRVAIPMGIFNSPIHLLRSTGGYISPATAMTSGVNAPIPSEAIELAMMRNKKVRLRALRTVPIRAKVRDISNIIRRPYMSESFPKMRVTKAPTSAGMETDQDIRCVLSKEAAISGRAMFEA